MCNFAATKVKVEGKKNCQLSVNGFETKLKLETSGMSSSALSSLVSIRESGGVVLDKFTEIPRRI